MSEHMVDRLRELHYATHQTRLERRRKAENALLVFGILLILALLQAAYG